jgi:hypothetical protein
MTGLAGLTMTDEYDPNKRMRRLRDAVKHSYENLSPMRETRILALQQYVGLHFALGGSARAVPLNLIKMATTIYMRSLASNPPGVMVSTKHKALKETALLLELDVNHLIEQIKLHDTMKLFTVESLFGMGIVKIALEPDKQTQINGAFFETGSPYVASLSLDDWVHDVTAKRWESTKFRGNRYIVDLEWAKQYPGFNKKVREGLVAKGSGQTPLELASHNSSISEANELQNEKARSAEIELDETIELVDLYMPRTNTIITLPWEGESVTPLREEEWTGPEEGPYRRQAYFEVPDTVSSLPPVSDMIDMHELSNCIMRKLGRQAVRQKTLLGASLSAAQDAETVRDAADGDVVNMIQPGSTKEFATGGIHQPNLAFLIWLEQNYSKMQGNLDSLGGLGPMSDTVGQDEIIKASASAMMEEMQKRNVTFLTGVVKDLAWYEWTDPLLSKTFYRNIGLPDMDIPVRFDTSSRSGDFLDYNIAIMPASMEQSSPPKKLQAIRQFFAEFIAPFAEQMGQAGISINWEQLTKTVAKLSNINEIEDLLIFSAPPQVKEPGIIGSPYQSAGSRGSAKPGSTTRRYVRENKASQDPNAKAASLVNKLLGANTQSGEQERAYR